MSTLGKITAILLTAFAALFGVGVLSAEEIKPLKGEYILRTISFFDGIDHDLKIKEIPGVKIIDKTQQMMLVSCATDEAAGQLKTLAGEMPEWKMFRHLLIPLPDPRLRVHSTRMGQWITARMEKGATGPAPLLQYKPVSVDVSAIKSPTNEPPKIQIRTMGYWRYLGKGPGVIVDPNGLSADVEGIGRQGTGYVTQIRKDGFLLKKGQKIPGVYESKWHMYTTWNALKPGLKTFVTMELRDIGALFSLPVRRLKI